MAHDEMSRLSRIETLWPVVQRAHGFPQDESAAALWQLLQRYRGAVYRYLSGAVRDSDAAEELFQEFALRFLRGDFRRANPNRGRFRDYVKSALINLVNDHHNRLRLAPKALPPDLAASSSGGSADAEPSFTKTWSRELMNQAWQELEKVNAKLYAVLHHCVENPGSQSPEMAQRLSAQLNEPLTAAHVRVMLHRGRAKYAELLVAEVRRSLGSPSEQELLSELRELRILTHCKPAMKGRNR